MSNSPMGTCTPSISDQRQIFHAFIAFYDFMGDTGQRARNITGIHHDSRIVPLCLVFSRHVKGAF